MKKSLSKKALKKTQQHLVRENNLMLLRGSNFINNYSQQYNYQYQGIEGLSRINNVPEIIHLDHLSKRNDTNIHTIPNSTALVNDNTEDGWEKIAEVNPTKMVISDSGVNLDSL